jgi:hypothetical protein
MGMLVQNCSRFSIFYLVAVKYFCNYSECNGEFVSVHAIEVYGRSENRAPLILNLCTRWR